MKWVRTSTVFFCANGENASAENSITEKNEVVVLAIYGSGVSFRPASGEDPIRRRIMQNGNLFWTEDASGIYYVSRDAVNNVASSLPKDTFVAGWVVYADRERAEECAAEKILELENVKTILHDRKLLNVVMGQWFHRLLMPVLLFWLIALALNFVVTTELGKSIGEIRAQERRNRQVSEKEAAITAQQERMVKEYSAMVMLESSQEMDFIASVLPDGILLSRVDVNGTSLVIKGGADNVQDVITYVRLLDESIEAEIRSIDESPEDKQYNFEIIVKR